MTRISQIAVALSVLAAPSFAAADPARVVATVGMIAEPAQTIAGECARVDTMMGPGIDPHLYNPSAGDVRALFDAQAVLYSGHNLEGQLGEVLGKLAAKKPVLAVAEAAERTENLILPAGEDYADPHLWMDVALWSRIAGPIAEVLTGLSPDCAGAAENGQAYVAKLVALDTWIRSAIETIPEERRVLVTAHDAFAYYGRAYGIEVLGIQGVSTESEAAIADIRKVVDLVVSRNVPAIFIESTINPRTIKAVIEAAEARGHKVRLGGELYSDAMGAPGTAGGTYIGMLHANTEAIVIALGGRLPPLPPELAEWAERWGVAG